MIGPSLAIDTSRYFVVCVNSLGSCFGSTGPASIDPATGERYRLDFPEVAVEDIARAGYEAVRALGIERLAAVMGASLGGMSVIALRDAVSARRAPPDQHFGQSPRPRRSRLRCARCSARPSCATRTGRAATIPPITRRATACAWRASSAPSPIARRPNGASASVASRSAGDAAARSSPFAPRFAVEGYLEAQAERFMRVFDPNCYLYLSQRHGSLRPRRARRQLRARRCAAVRGEAVLVIGVESDLLFPIHEQAAIAEAFEQNALPTRFVRLPSLEGHDAFLVDIPRFDAEIRTFLD